MIWLQQRYAAVTRAEQTENLVRWLAARGVGMGFFWDVYATRRLIYALNVAVSFVYFSNKDVAYTAFILLTRNDLLVHGDQNKCLEGRTSAHDLAIPLRDVSANQSSIAVTNNTDNLCKGNNIGTHSNAIVMTIEEKYLRLRKSNTTAWSSNMKSVM